MTTKQEDLQELYNNNNSTITVVADEAATLPEEFMNFNDTITPASPIETVTVALPNPPPPEPNMSYDATNLVEHQQTAIAADVTAIDEAKDFGNTTELDDHLEPTDAPYSVMSPTQDAGADEEVENVVITHEGDIEEE